MPGKDKKKQKGYPKPKKTTFSSISKDALKKYIGNYVLHFIPNDSKSQLENLFLTKNGWSEAMAAWQSFWSHDLKELTVPSDIDPKLGDVFRYMHLCTIFFSFGT